MTDDEQVGAFRDAVAMCLHVERGDAAASWTLWQTAPDRAAVLACLVELPRVVLESAGVPRATAVAHLERILHEHQVAATPPDYNRREIGRDG